MAAFWPLFAKEFSNAVHVSISSLVMVFEETFSLLILLPVPSIHLRGTPPIWMSTSSIFQKHHSLFGSSFLSLKTCFTLLTSQYWRDPIFLYCRDGHCRSLTSWFMWGMHHLAIFPPPSQQQLVSPLITFFDSLIALTEKLSQS